MVKGRTCVSRKEPSGLDMAMKPKGRANDLSSAKSLICYLGYYQLGINGKELARYFGISRPSVSQAIKRGEKFAKENDVKLLS
jgi:DNA-binding MarR family transcriptional regulator